MGCGDGRYCTDEINAKVIVKKGVEIFIGTYSSITISVVPGTASTSAQQHQLLQY